ncbi:DNA double-strand break repair nuclease NurA [Acetohalobium arabaticum]|uniref:NurA domain protein n=1 Tax=Acetohalobium arabaticum (strain ATCC 49924 / DSM 5501 / Z-7288) TaxID=574087 RepID=D9QPJ8_ACEAZ|nr:DNA double-strand break repair nuclease NurA [Acetohalobium arabaticum]ADL12439.1 NurA domain protein [Acetohalobium arabaticum DSM 5501]
MGFENEFASYEPLRRIMSSEKVKNLQNRFKRRQRENEEFDNFIRDETILKDDLNKDGCLPNKIIAIDGSKQAVKAENGFPGSEFGYITIASVLIFVDKIRELEQREFIHPQEYRETEKATSIDGVLPGCNIIVDNEKTAKESFRKILYEELKDYKVFSDCETLLETYEYILELKLEDEKENNSSAPKSPIGSVDKEMTYGFGEYKCPHSGKTLYSTDALRLHELMKSGGTNGELYGQVMQTFEKLFLVHLLRSFEQKGWVSILDEIAFVLDGPLAVFSASSWLAKYIRREINRINKKQKKFSNKDMIIFGIEKSGMFVDHFIEVDREIYNEEKDKREKLIPNQSLFLIDDKYIKDNIIFSDAKKQYGSETYFGRKLFYKTQNGYHLVPVIISYTQEQLDLSKAKVNQFPRLADVLSILDELVSVRYPNSLTPLISAHSEAAIPLNLGEKVFEKIAEEIKEKN